MSFLLQWLGAEQTLVFGVLRHEETCVVGDKIVGNFEVFARGFDARLPSDAIDHQPRTQMLVPAFHKRLKGEPLEEAVDVGVLKVPRPPPFLLRRIRRGCHRRGHRWLALAQMVSRRAGRTRPKDMGWLHPAAS
jgi:hypothetical protein